MDCAQICCIWASDDYELRFAWLLIANPTRMQSKCVKKSPEGFMQLPSMVFIHLSWFFFFLLKQRETQLICGVTKLLTAHSLSNAAASWSGFTAYCFSTSSSSSFLSSSSSSSCISFIVSLDSTDKSTNCWTGPSFNGDVTVTGRWGWRHWQRRQGGARQGKCYNRR